MAWAKHTDQWAGVAVIKDGLESSGEFGNREAI
jgi:hypothetical protein